ncbi:small acid-soluble spore protein Tlp [Desulfotomaculum copahuensis]|uniref:small acid-soluble spore protein Tlp n=1 Tax=Desulfotomaculum copahuensis TaxID=1838280 RepID=UPI00191BA7A6|nr:small acid-soluble spore protein Tlp [Desulfotomaculum copahuensis]
MFLAKPDDRSDNVEKMQRMIQNSIENWHEARETLSNTDMSDEQREAVKAKNRRREEAIENFREEIKDEYHDRLE